MLTINRNKGSLIKVAITTLIFFLAANCSSEKVYEKTFSLYLNDKKYSELLHSMQAYAAKHTYYVTSETIQGNRIETTAQHIMVEGDGIRTLLQSALAEQCEEREGRRDVEYSSRVFDVNVFSTTYFTSDHEISRNVEQLKLALRNYGFRIVSRSESCSLL